MNKFDKTVNRYLQEAVQPDGPVTDTTGNKRWYKDDKLHRLDGPAVKWTNGAKEWYINGKQLTEKEFNEYIKKQEISKEIQSHKNNRIDPGMLEDYL